MADILAYLQEHPVMVGVMVCTAILALVGLWYVIMNVVYQNLQVIIITLLCAAGFGSGCWVLYRGVIAGAGDLMAIGVFLIAIFPIIFIQALRLSASEVHDSKLPDKAALSKAFGLPPGRKP